MYRLTYGRNDRQQTGWQSGKQAGGQAGSTAERKIALIDIKTYIYG